MTSRRIPAMLVLVVVCSMGCARARRPDGPYRAAEELTDALSDEAVDCTRAHGAKGSGMIMVAAEFTAAGQPPKVHDAGSTPGNEAVIACVQARATEKLRSPATRPAPFVRVRVPLPLVPAEVKYVFVQQLQSTPSAQ